MVRAKCWTTRVHLSACTAQVVLFCSFYVSAQAAIGGGNCELTKLNQKYVTDNGVTIIGCSVLEVSQHECQAWPTCPPAWQSRPAPCTRRTWPTSCATCTIPKVPHIRRPSSNNSDRQGGHLREEPLRGPGPGRGGRHCGAQHCVLQGWHSRGHASSATAHPHQAQACERAGRLQWFVCAMVITVLSTP